MNDQLSYGFALGFAFAGLLAAGIGWYGWRALRDETPETRDR